MKLKLYSIATMLGAGLLIANSASAQWSLTGNAGTTPGTNYIGTSDAKNLQIKTNNATRMTITSSGKVGVGVTSPKARFEVGANTGGSGIPAVRVYQNNCGGACGQVNGAAIQVVNSNTSGAQNGAYISFADPINVTNNDDGAASINLVDRNSISGYGGLGFSTRNSTGLAERVRIDISGNVGIGTIAPGAKLDVAGTIKTSDIKITTGAVNGYVLTSDGSGTASWQPAPGSVSSPWTTTGNNIYNNNSGKVGIGTSAPNTLLEVGAQNTTNYNAIRVNTSYPLQQNGLISNGYEIRVQDGFNSFRTYSTGQYYRLAISTDGLATSSDIFRTDGGTFEPAPDNTITLGSASHRWNSVWSANGTIQTSDERYKTNVAELNYGLSAVMKMRPVSYVWKDEKMKVGTGTNLGFIAQDLESVVPDVVIHTINGKDKETGAEPAEKISYGVKYAELVPVLTKAIQEQQAQIEQLQKQLETKDTKTAALQNQLNDMQQCVESLCRYYLTKCVSRKVILKIF